MNGFMGDTTLDTGSQTGTAWFTQPGGRQFISLPGLCNIGNPPETYPHLKSRDISFYHNMRASYPILLEFCTEHDSITLLLFAKFLNDWVSCGQMGFHENWV